jgi:hypothetical protein
MDGWILPFGLSPRRVSTSQPALPIADSARIVSASSASRLPSAPLSAALRGPDPKVQDLANRVFGSSKLKY